MKTTKNLKSLKNFQDYFENQELIQYFEEHKILELTDVQKKIIPDFKLGKNLDIVAPTGSGKTLSYLLPLFELLKIDEEFQATFDRPEFEKNQGKFGAPRAVIITPTRELATQVFTVAKSLSHFLKLKIRKFVGGDKTPQSQQLQRLEIDVVISTPGRLSEALKKKELNVKFTKYFILDEADQLLEMGFHKELENIYHSMDHSLVHLALLSATRPDRFVEFRNKAFNKHQFHFYEIYGLNKVHTHVKSFNVFVHEKEKLEMLQTLLANEAKGKGVVFVNQQKSVSSVLEFLVKTFPQWKFLGLHGELLPEERSKILKEFVHKKVILVATDIVARGMDVPDLRWVVNFDLPFEAIYYVHRAGRVGRLKREGEVYNFVTAKDGLIVKRINQAILSQSAIKLTPFDEKRFPKNPKVKISKAKPKEQKVIELEKKEKELLKIKAKLGILDQSNSQTVSDKKHKSEKHYIKTVSPKNSPRFKIKQSKKEKPFTHKREKPKPKHRKNHSS